MIEKRYMIDDCGTLIDNETRNTYDYVNEVCPILNQLAEENELLKAAVSHYKLLVMIRKRRRKTLKKTDKGVKSMKPYLTLLYLIIGILFIILYITINNPIWKVIDLTLAIYNISVFTYHFWRLIENE